MTPGMPVQTVAGYRGTNETERNHRMADQKKSDPIAQGAPQASQERADKQGGAGWPEPGQEGFVHPDGTLQAEEQLKANKQAAADRAAAGSYIHGAPLARPGVDPQAETAKAVERAEK